MRRLNLSALCVAVVSAVWALPAAALPLGPYYQSMRFTLPPSAGGVVHGQLKLDVMLDGSQTYSDIPAFAQPTSYVDSNGVLQPNPAAAHQSMNLGLRESTLDLAYGEALSPSWHMEGAIELDFLGYLASSTDASSPTPVLRLAYAHLSNGGPWSFDVGQLQGPFSPLDPPTLNGNLDAYAGNLISRLPQLRCQYSAGPWSLAGAVVRPANLATDIRGSGFDLVGHGQDSGLPELQGRLAWRPADVKVPYDAQLIPAEIGLSGRLAQEAYLPGTVAESRFSSWGISLDGRYPLGDRFWLTGEVYRGHALDTDYGLSGIAGLATASAFIPQVSVPETGGWAALGCHLLPGIDSHFIYGLAAPDSGLYAKSGWQQSSGLDVTRNESLALNFLWHLFPTSALGFEIFHLNTDYLPISDGGTKTDGTFDRLELSWIQGF